QGGLARRYLGAGLDVGRMVQGEAGDREEQQPRQRHRGTDPVPAMQVLEPPGAAAAGARRGAARRALWRTGRNDGWLGGQGGRQGRRWAGGRSWPAGVRYGRAARGREGRAVADDSTGTGTIII